VGVAGASADSLAYVTNEQAGTISQVDLTTGTVGAPIHVGSQPYAIAITPDGSTAYVADYGSSEIVPVALATATVETPIVLNDRPNAIAITPTGKTAYVIADTGREWPIRLSNRQVGNPTQIPANADSVAITPNGNTAYITDVATGTMEPFSLLNGALLPTVNLGVSTPDGIAITPDGSTAYVASNSGGTITPVTLATGTTGTAIPAGTEPSAVAISPDGMAYVTDFGTGQVTPITLATATAGAPITVGPDPSAIALVPPTGITTAPSTGNGSGAGGGSGSGGANSGSVGNQQLTLTVSGTSGSSATAQTCRAPGSTISVRMTRKTLPHGARLTLRYVTFALGKQLKRVKRLPATVRLSLRGLRHGANTLTVRAFYNEKLAANARRGKKRRKLTVTLSKTLKTRITVC
jgi:YVTN family beta-propeller protein